MTTLKPYLNYLKENMKIFFIAVSIVTLIFLAVSLCINLAYLNSIRNGAGPKATEISISSLRESMGGIISVYGILLSATEFNVLMNIRADRKSIMIASIISLIKFAVMSMILFSIAFIGYKYIILAMSPVPVSFEKIYIMELVLFIIFQSSLALVLGALLYRFGWIKMIIGIIVLASIVVLFGVSPSSFIQALGYKILYYIEIALENYEVVLTPIFTLIMYTIYWLIMRKAPIKEYAKKKIFNSKK